MHEVLCSQETRLHRQIRSTCLAGSSDLRR